MNMNKYEQTWMNMNEYELICANMHKYEQIWDLTVDEYEQTCANMHANSRLSSLRPWRLRAPSASTYHQAPFLRCFTLPFDLMSPLLFTCLCWSRIMRSSLSWMELKACGFVNSISWFPLSRFVIWYTRLIVRRPTHMDFLGTWLTSHSRHHLHPFPPLSNPSWVTTMSSIAASLQYSTQLRILVVAAPTRLDIDSPRACCHLTSSRKMHENVLGI
jgi:hypothetical protein